MNNNNAIEIEGELDEDDFQENQLSEEKKSYEFHQSIKENEIIDSSNLMNLEQMLKGIQNCYEKELKSALSSCENLSKDQIKSFDILEKFQSDFYSKEMIEIQETFGLVPHYLRKISEIKEKMKDIEKKMNVFKAKKSHKINK